MCSGMCRAGIALMLGLLGGLGIPTAVWAQAGYYVTPSFSFSEVYDDNLFSTSTGRESDIYSRFSPSLQGGYQSAPLTLLGSYAFDSEVYPGHPELTKALAGQRASIEASYRPDRFLTLSFIAQYTESETSRDINTLTGIDQGRRRSQQYSFSPSVGYRFSPFTSGNAGYAFSQVASGGSTSSHTLNLGLNQQITPKDTISMGVVGRLFFSPQDRGDSFSTQDRGDSTESYAITLGWSRPLTSFTTMALQAGPRLTEGSLGAEVLASISQRLKNGQVSLTYSQSQNLVAGLSNAVNTNSFAASISYEPLRRLQLGAIASISRNTQVQSTQTRTGDTQGDNTVNVYALGLNASYPFNKWLSLQSSYQFSFQQGILSSSSAAVTGNGGDIYHNIVTLGLAITFPSRVY